MKNQKLYAVPSRYFLLRTGLDGMKRTVTKAGIVIEVTREEAQQFAHSFIRVSTQRAMTHRVGVLT